MVDMAMKTVRLGNVSFYVNDKTDTNDVSIDEFITTDNMLQNKQGIALSVIPPLADSKITSFKRNDILIANIRPYLKKIWYAQFNGGCSNDVLVIRPNKHIDNQFLYYALFRDDFFDFAMKGAKGTKMPRGDKNQIMNFEIPDFDLKTQQSIAKILSQLDQKIALNNQINAQLEQMAKTLYDYWFVQFDFPDENGKPYKSSGGAMIYNEQLKREIPKGWGVGVLSEWIKSDKNGDWGKENQQGNYQLEVVCIRGADINDIKNNGNNNAPIRFILNKNSDKVIDNYEFVIEISGGSPTQSTGRIAPISAYVINRFDSPLICSNFCKVISLKEKYYFYNFYYLWQSLYDNGILFGWEGKTSGIKNLLFDNFVNGYLEVMPTLTIAKKFFEKINKINQKQNLLLKQNQQLTQLRDFLLPMLMNGQVGVRDE